VEEDLTELTGLTESKLTRNITKIIAVRHAESVANSQGIYQGQTYDTDLSELGKKQAEALAKKAKDVGINRIISSPLKRTYQTAIVISRACNCPIEISELITETNQGEWEGRDKKKIESLYPDIYNTWLTKPSQSVFPKGEAFTQTLARIELFLHTVGLTDNTLLVTHDNVLRIMVTLANGWTLDDIWMHNIEPAALNFFEINKVGGKSKLKVLELNRNEHLGNLRSDIKKHAL